MNEERILFVIPPYFNVDDYVTENSSRILPPFTIPYGVLSLSAYITNKCSRKVQVRIFDLNVSLKNAIASTDRVNVDTLFKDLLLQQNKDFHPTIIGISALFNISFRYLEDLAGITKSENDECLVVAGGGLPSAGYKEVLQLCPSVDAVCRGEGEIPLQALIDASSKSDLLNSHPSWVTRAKVSANILPQHTFVQNLDEIPMFDYSLISLDDYNARSIDKRYSGDQKREMAIHTSRGCPFTCVFCANPFLHGNTVRAMSVARVVDEVRVMKAQHGLTVLLIEDDHFFFDKKRAKQILRELSSLDIRIEFPNGIAVYAVDDEVAELLSKAGASTVALAVESGSDYVLKNLIGKPLKTCNIKDKVELLRKHGVQSHAFVVIGLPGEMPEHRQETLDMLLNVGFDWTHVFCAVPVFGSRLYDICVEKGYLKQTSFLEHVNSKCVITAPGVDPEEIEQTAYAINLNVNFVNNYNLKTGNFETAVKYFSNVTSKYPDHAFGHYFLAKAFEGVGDHTHADIERASFNRIVSNNPWWQTLSKRFELI